MAKYKMQYEKCGGKELKAIINGKLTGVKHDKGANTFYVSISQLTGRTDTRYGE